MLLKLSTLTPAELGRVVTFLLVLLSLLLASTSPAYFNVISSGVSGPDKN